ncbi:MAG: hypothetical protein WC951_01255 [Bacteroidales bacterium]
MTENIKYQHPTKGVLQTGFLADLESFQLLLNFVSGGNDAVSISSSQHTPSR